MPFFIFNMRHLLTLFKDKNNLLRNQNSIIQKKALTQHNSNPQNLKISLEKLYFCIVSN